jgi:hypothetical protein
MRQRTERGVQLKFLLNAGNEHAGGHGAADLRLDGAVAVAQKILDVQGLFDPFGKQPDMPNALVPSGHGHGREGRVIGIGQGGSVNAGAKAQNAKPLGANQAAHARVSKRHPKNQLHGSPGKAFSSN